jgi:hypothetical protein
MVVLLVAMLLPPRYTRGADLAVVASFYVLAKALESSDRIIFSVGHTIRRPTPKHFAVAAAGYWILRILQRRKPILSSSSPRLGSPSCLGVSKLAILHGTRA